MCSVVTSLMFGFGARRRLGSDRMLQVGIEPLFGVEFRAVTGQIKHFDFLLSLRHPRLHWLAVVYAKIVQ